jgi:hypothetical protein
VALKS